MEARRTSRPLDRAVEALAAAMLAVMVVMVFGTPVEVTLSELAVEAFYPADAETAALLTGR